MNRPRPLPDQPRPVQPGQPELETWQHDLFRGDHTPYARAVIDLIKESIAASRK